MSDDFWVADKRARYLFAQETAVIFLEVSLGKSFVSFNTFPDSRSRLTSTGSSTCS